MGHPDFRRIKATDQHKEAVQNFMFALYNGTLEELWSMIAEVDQMGLYAEYSIIGNNMNDYDSFRDYFETIRDEQRIKYSRVKANCGLVNYALYSEDGEVYMCLVENVKLTTIRHFSAAGPNNDLQPIRLVVNMKYDPETVQYHAHWKVRTAENDFKTALNA